MQEQTIEAAPTLERHRTGRLVARAVAGIGWFIVAFGAMTALGGLVVGVAGGPMGRIIGLSTFAGGLVAGALGVIAIAQGELLRGVIDTAENTASLVEIMHR